jgi:hypothetical protein
MNSEQILQELPDFFRSYLEGAAPAEWTVPPVEGLGAGSWQFRISATPNVLVAIKVLGNDAHEMRITVGLAIDVPYSSTLSEYVNYLNNKNLIFGRAFIAGNIPFIGETGDGPAVVVMQEIVFGPSLSFDFPPSMQNLLSLVARLAAQADTFAPDLIERFGGRPLTDDDGVVLTLY